MTQHVDLADGTPVIRKVQWSTYGATTAAAIGSQIAPILAEPLAYIIATRFAFWNNDTAYLALGTLLEMLFLSLFAGAGALTGGYMARSRPTDLVAKEPQP